MRASETSKSGEPFNLEDVEGFLTIARFPHHVTCIAQHLLEQLDAVAVVFDNEDIHEADGRRSMVRRMNSMGSKGFSR